MNPSPNTRETHKVKAVRSAKNPQRLSALRRDLRRDWQLYLFLILPIAYLIIFSYLPMGGLVMAFQDYKPRLGFFRSEWVAFQNFIDFFQSYQFVRVLKNTLVLSIYTLLAGFPIPVCFALIVNCIPGKRFRKTCQAIVNLPHFISVTVMVGILFQLLNSRTGLYGLFGEMLTGAYPKDLFGSTGAFRHLYVWSGVWQEFGWSSIVYTAALASVDPDLHEAAQLDGASRFQRLIHIDLPAIAPTIVIMLILRMGSVMSIGFEKVFLMQNPLNVSTSEIISTYVYQVGLAASGRSDFSYATAISMFNAVINLILITTTNRIADKVSGSSLW